MIKNRIKTGCIIATKILFVVAIFLSPDALAQFGRTDSMQIAVNVARPYIPDNHYNSSRDESNEVSYPFLKSLFQRDNISGDWWNLRNSLSETGLDFEFVYKGELFSNASGGSEKNTTTLDNIDLIISSDLDKSLGWKGSSLKIQFLGNSGGAPGEFSGAIQGVTNIEAVSTWKLYQLLLENKFFDEKLSVAVGLYDLNSEFDTRETSSIFINPSHGIGPDFSQSGLNGPSIFPTTSAAIRVKYETGNGEYFQTALLDGVPGDPENPYGTKIIFNGNDGLLLTYEMGIMKSVSEVLDYKVALGAWTYTSKFEKNNFTDLPEVRISNERNYGFYLTAEKLLGMDAENPSKNLTAFLRLGYASEKINPVDLYLGTGIKLSGLFSKTSDDVLGLALALCHTSFYLRNSSMILEEVIVRPYEINLEATYSFNITPWMIIQPDIQYIINPSFCERFNSALLVGTRVQLNF